MKIGKQKIDSTERVINWLFNVIKKLCSILTDNIKNTGRFYYKWRLFQPLLIFAHIENLYKNIYPLSKSNSYIIKNIGKYGWIHIQLI